MKVFEQQLLLPKPSLQQKSVLNKPEAPQGTMFEKESSATVKAQPMFSPGTVCELTILTLLRAIWRTPGFIGTGTSEVIISTPRAIPGRGTY